MSIYTKIVFLLIFTPLFVFAELDETLQSQLLSMAEADQLVRKQLGEAGWDKAPKELHAKLSKVDQENTEKLKAILNERAWFSLDEVGKEGIGAAFLIIQHSPDREFQKTMLPILKESYLKDEGVSGQEVALLTDRVLIHMGQKQLYGTQADIKNGEISFLPISNEELVDQRRSEMNLPPMDFYKKLLEEMYGLKEHPEIDLN